MVAIALGVADLAGVFPFYRGLWEALSILGALYAKVQGEMLACATATCPPDVSGAFKQLQSLVLGAGGALTLYYLAKRSHALQKTAEANLAAIEKRTEELAMTRRDHLSKRFSESVKQLGDDKLAIRLGGIAGLAAVAQETNAKADQVIVCDVLCAYVRMERPKAEGPDASPSDDPPRETALPEDIKSILSVLSARSSAFTAGFRRDLSGADLRGANLVGADLSGADLRVANLLGADLSLANLNQANLSDAYLSGVYLFNANLSEADLSGTNLNWADLSKADLSKADLSKADLSGANLSEAKVMGINLRGSNLSGADLSEANLSGADLRKANLSGANLSQANLSGVRLSNANLSKAYLLLANLNWANLFGANMREVDLRNAYLLLANLNWVDLFGADLSLADLREANLSGANMMKIDLRGANLSGTNLNWVDLSKANLTGAKVTREQLEAAESLEGAIGLPESTDSPAS
ncbi:hypothetical protein ROR02_21340 [Pararhodospirillum oryzae]|uniref:Pentapeptide repeat-containing protein n=1 Tax=Pararhodospirillum oryzae TaxID=478448 RepID=A0A512H974_9PROT|nr:hypothetical protein ROR02_21340 [Pararhodospirillum oryzae]